MEIEYDKKIKIVGVGIVPWTRLGLERWLDDYRIVSLDCCDFSSDICIGINNKKIKPSFSSIVKSDDFKEILESQLQGYKILTYKPLKNPSSDFISADFELAINLENKAYFRRKFSDIVKFADFRIINKISLTKSNAKEIIFSDWDKVVVQNAISSGGKGTTMISQSDNFIEKLEGMGCFNGDGEIVVSKAVENGFERSVQAVICKDNIFVGPLQTQIISRKELMNSNGSGEKFCGIQISPNDKFSAKYSDFANIVKKIGERMRANGYRGVFGVDFLVTEDGIFVLEVNPRLTGATPLLTSAFEAGDIPFQLLHALELGGYTYKIIGEVKPSKTARSTILLHGKNIGRAKITKNLASGIYDFNMNLVSRSLDFSELSVGQVLIQQYAPVDAEIRDGGRVLIANFNSEVLDNDDNFRDEIKRVIELIYSKIEFEEV